MVPSAITTITKQHRVTIDGLLQTSAHARSAGTPTTSSVAKLGMWHVRRTQLHSHTGRPAVRFLKLPRSLGLGTFAFTLGAVLTLDVTVSGKKHDYKECTQLQLLALDCGIWAGCNMLTTSSMHAYTSSWSSLCLSIADRWLTVKGRPTKKLGPQIGTMAKCFRQSASLMYISACVPSPAAVAEASHLSAP